SPRDGAPMPPVPHVVPPRDRRPAEPGPVGERRTLFHGGAPDPRRVVAVRVDDRRPRQPVAKPCENPPTSPLVLDEPGFAGLAGVDADVGGALDAAVEPDAGSPDNRLSPATRGGAASVTSTERYSSPGLSAPSARKAVVSPPCSRSPTAS